MDSMWEEAREFIIGEREATKKNHFLGFSGIIEGIKKKRKNKLKTRNNFPPCFRSFTANFEHTLEWLECPSVDNSWQSRLTGNLASASKLMQFDTHPLKVTTLPCWLGQSGSIMVNNGLEFYGLFTFAFNNTRSCKTHECFRYILVKNMGPTQVYVIKINVYKYLIIKPSNVQTWLVDKSHMTLKGITCLFWFAIWHTVWLY